MKMFEVKYKLILLNLNRKTLVMWLYLYYININIINKQSKSADIIPTITLNSTTDVW